MTNAKSGIARDAPGTRMAVHRGHERVGKAQMPSRAFSPAASLPACEECDRHPSDCPRTVLDRHGDSGQGVTVDGRAVP
jgi:hypothetical protein